MKNNHNNTYLLLFYILIFDFISLFFAALSDQNHWSQQSDDMQEFGKMIPSEFREFSTVIYEHTHTHAHTQTNTSHTLKFKRSQLQRQT